MSKNHIFTGLDLKHHDLFWKKQFRWKYLHDECNWKIHVKVVLGPFFLIPFQCFCSLSWIVHYDLNIVMMDMWVISMHARISLIMTSFLVCFRYLTLYILVRNTRIVARLHHVKFLVNQRNHCENLFLWTKEPLIFQKTFLKWEIVWIWKRLFEKNYFAKIFLPRKNFHDEFFFWAQFRQVFHIDICE